MSLAAALAVLLVLDALKRKLGIGLRSRSGGAIAV